MQKLINVLALVSFGVSGTIIGAGIYVMVNRDALTEQIKERVMSGVEAAIGEAMGGALAEDALGAATMPSPVAETPVPLPISPF